MAEFLDDKLPEKWNTVATRNLMIHLYQHISKRLAAIEDNLGITPSTIEQDKPDMNKIKRPKKKGENE